MEAVEPDTETVAASSSEERSGVLQRLAAESARQLERQHVADPQLVVGKLAHRLRWHVHDIDVEAVLYAAVFVGCGGRDSRHADAHGRNGQVVPAHHLDGGDAFVRRHRLAFLGRAPIGVAQIHHVRAGADGQRQVVQGIDYPRRLGGRVLRRQPCHGNHSQQQCTHSRQR